MEKQKERTHSLLPQSDMVVQLTRDSNHAVGVDVSVNSPVTNWRAVLGVPCLLPGPHPPDPELDKKNGWI